MNLIIWIKVEDQQTNQHCHPDATKMAGTADGNELLAIILHIASLLVMVLVQ